MEHAERGAASARIRCGSGDNHINDDGRESSRQDVKTLGFDAIVVRHQYPHAMKVALRLYRDRPQSQRHRRPSPLQSRQQQHDDDGADGDPDHLHVS